MYRKKYTDLKFTPSDNPRTRKKQEARFKRRYDRTFKINKLGPPKSVEDQLAMAKKSHFLFSESHFINKPISHLKYDRRDILPDAQDYNFLVPFFSFKLNTRTRIEKQINAPPSPSNLQPLADVTS
jgi:hypothetical protein